MTESTPTSVIPFTFNSKQFRAIKKEDGSIWIVAKDACDQLDFSDVSMTVQPLDDDEKGTSKICTPGGPQDMLIISESGLYTLIIRSNKEAARPFRRWVTHEVLPSLRKTGRYVAPGGFSSKEEVAKICQAGKELEGVARAFKSALSIAKATGMPQHKAVEAANAATFERTGCDCLDMLNVRHLLGPDSGTRKPSREWGEALLDAIFNCQITLPIPGDNGRKILDMAVGDVLADANLYEGFKAEIEAWGIKKVDGGWFFHPATLEAGILTNDASDWTGYNTREFLLAIPGVRPAQLRLSGVAVRGVIVPHIALRMKGGAS